MPDNINNRNRKADSAYLVVGRWNGHEQVWRGGVFDSEQDAEDEFVRYQQEEAAIGEIDIEFVRVMRVSTAPDTNHPTA